MDRRRFGQIFLGGLIAVISPKIADNGLELIASVSASDKAKRKSNDKEQKTVNHILNGTSFDDVCSNDYYNQVRYGDVIVFFYDDDDGIDNASGRLAQVLRIVNPEFKDKITFLKYRYDCDPSLGYQGYQGLMDRFNVSDMPQVNFFRDGHIVDQLKGGPLDDSNINNLADDFRRELNRMYK
ncbi:MAG: hypothetical protein ABIG89_02005 [Candidatus Woesearchaeota archaeon]